MRPSRHYKNYALALMNVAETVDAVRDVYNSLRTLSLLLRTDTVFRSFFLTRRIPSDSKYQILTDILKDECHPIAVQFFSLLSNRKEWALFQPVSAEYEMIMKDRLNLLSITAITAEQLGDEDYSAIVANLEKSTGKTGDFHHQVDSSLLGGMKLRIGNIFMDGTLKNRVQQLQQELLKS